VPSAVGDFLVLDCIRASHGSTVAVPESEISDMQRRLASLGLGYVSLETAAAAVGLGALISSQLIAPGDSVVLFDTGAGFKSDPPSGLLAPRPVPNDPDVWKEKVLPSLR